VSAIDRLKALEEAGIDLSRNRHFAFFQTPENRRALTLDHYLDALASELHDGARLGSLALTLSPDEHGRLALGVSREDLSVQHTAHLSPEEFDELVTRDGVANILAKQGIHWT
jgi:hypothetical protein